MEIRLSDTDAMGHVNNARYLTYVEIARVAYYERVTGNALPIGTHGAEEGMILAEIRMTYRSPAFYGETLRVETAHREAIGPLVLGGAGTSFLPRGLADALGEQGAVVAKLVPAVTRTIGLLHRASPLTPAARAFVELARARL